MFERKLLIFSLVFMIGIFSLFVNVPKIYAVGCGVACGGSVTCDAGLTCTAGVCQKPVPSCSGAYPEATITNRTTGSFEVAATGVTNAESVTFYVWSSINNQDDLWPPGGNGIYPGVDQGGGVWKATINLANHSAGAGTINVHVYKFNCSYPTLDGNTWCGTANFEIDQTQPICAMISGDTSVCRGESAAYSMDATDTNLNEGGIYYAPAGTQNWNRFCTSGGDCTASTNFSAYPAANSFDVVCNAFDSAGNKCSGNPTYYDYPGWADCGASDAITVNITEPPAYVACPTACGSLASNQPDGTCTGTHACACVSEAPNEKPVITSIGPSCSTDGVVTGDWTFTGMGGCGGSWGYACSGASNAFRIRDSGGLLVDGISASARAYTGPLAAGAHSIQICAFNGQTENCSTPFAVNVSVDTTAPPVPVPTIQFSADGSCLGKYNVVHSWNAVSDSGCAGMNALPYWSQASLTPTPAFPNNVFPTNTWGTYTSQTISTSYAPGTTLYTHVQSRDTLDNQSAWSGPETVVIPTPSPYPTIHISGSIIEDINRSCNPMSLMSNFTPEPTIIGSPGITPAVTPICPTLGPGDSSYACDFIIDNQNGDCVSPDIQIMMGGTYSGYGSIGWRSGDTAAEQCAGFPTSRSYIVGGPTPASVPIYFSYNTILPTVTPTPTPGGPSPTPTPPGGPPPTPTPTPVAGWFKLSQTSFNSRQSSRQNFIPYNIAKFTSTDPDDSTANHNIMIGRGGIGSSGLLAQDDVVQPGANAYTGGVLTYSSNNWYTNGYAHINDVSYSTYLDYVKSRKDYQTITNLNQITTDGIYSIATPVSLTAAQFDGKKVVLVITDGSSATFSGTDFISTGSVAVLAKNIIIDSTVTQINAILIGETVTTGASSTGLKIIGNLIDESALTIDRAQSDGKKPSLFIVFDTQLYLNILPYLSTSTYDWRQIQ